MDTFNVALNCGSFLLPWNAVMLSFGIIVAVIVTEIIVKKRKLYKDLALDVCIVGIPCGIVGGRLFSALSGKVPFASIFDMMHTGMNLPGTLLFAAIGILIYIRLKKLACGATLDALMPGAFFGLAVGRWSDFFLCEGLGPVVEAGVPKFFPLVTFTNAYFADQKTVAYAVFFLDFLICLALGAVSLMLLKKKLAAGRTVLTTSILYLFAEFILEWLRDGSARQIVVGELRFNQLVLLGLLMLTVIAAIVSKNRIPASETAQQDAPNTGTCDEEPDPEVPKQEE